MFQEGCWQTHHRADALPVAMAARLRFRFLKVDLPIRWRSAASCKKNDACVQVTLDADNMCMSYTHVRQQNRRPALLQQCCICACIDSSCVEEDLENSGFAGCYWFVSTIGKTAMHTSIVITLCVQECPQEVPQMQISTRNNAGPPGPRSVT